MSSRQSLIAVRSDSAGPLAPYVDSLAKGIQSGMETWLAQNHFSSDTALTLDFQAFALSPERMDITLHVSGTLNRLSVGHSVERSWDDPFTNLLEGRRLQKAIHGAIQQQLYELDPSIRIPYDRWREINSEILYDVLRGLEAAVGIEDSPASRRMRLVYQISTYAPILLACLMLAIFIQSDKMFGPKRDKFNFACQCLSVAVLSWLFGYLLILCAGILSMPARFFQCEAEGINFLAMTGVSSTGAVRVVAGLLCLVSIAALTGYLVFVFQPP